MNSLSKALSDGHYPKVIRVSEYDSFGILDEFYCWAFADTSFYAHYMTRSGASKKCLVMIFKGEE